MSTDDVEARMARAVSIGTPPATAAAWIEGFLAGGGLLLIHDEQLLALQDLLRASIDALRDVRAAGTTHHR